MSAQNLNGHLLDAFFVIEELTFILNQKRLCQLTNRCAPTSINQGPYQKWLIDMRHSHSVFYEVDQLIKGHHLNPKIKRNSINSHPTTSQSPQAPTPPTYPTRRDSAHEPGSGRP